MGRGGEIDLGTVNLEMLPTLGRERVHELWRRLHRKPPPKGLTGELLVRALAWRMQCEHHGGVSRGTRLRLARLARQAARELARPNDDRCSDGAAAASTPSRRALRSGTRLVREWQGQVHEVTALPDGFLWEGKTHRSLSVIAKAITGTSWNGWLFFGLNQKPARATSSKMGAGPTSTSPSKTVERHDMEGTSHA